MTPRRAVVAVLLLAAVAAAGCDAFRDDQRSLPRERDRDAGEWTLIAQRSIDFRSDRESIGIDSERRVRALRVVVKGGSVEIGNIVVTFGDESTFSPQVRSEFSEGSESRAIDLPGEARRIRRIDLSARSTSKREGRATIMIYGR
jgi:hypothetical protein